MLVLRKALIGQSSPRQNFYPASPYACFPLFRTDFFISNYKISTDRTPAGTS